MGYRIIHEEKLSPTVSLFRIEAPLIARKAKPGQFIILRIDERGERIPLTVVDRSDEGTITLVVLEVGKTTKHLNSLKEGDQVLNCVGPLGNPAVIKRYGTVVCIGGGVGIACIYPEVRALKEAGNRIISIIGARTRELLFFEKEIEELSDEFYVTTDDGSKGHRGFVSDVLRKLIGERRQIDLVIAVGPVMMMKVIADLTRPHGIKTIVSLNPIMVDGTGMCGSCRVEVGGETRFACVDGPEFDAHLINFDLLMARNERYLAEEKLSLERFEGRSAKGQ